MSTLFYERNPFDILVRNFFQDAGAYRPLAESKLPHPVDIYERDNGFYIVESQLGVRTFRTEGITLDTHWEW